MVVHDFCPREITLKIITNIKEKYFYESIISYFGNWFRISFHYQKKKFLTLGWKSKNNWRSLKECSFMIGILYRGCIQTIWLSSVFTLSVNVVCLKLSNKVVLKFSVSKTVPRIGHESVLQYSISFHKLDISTACFKLH